MTLPVLPLVILVLLIVLVGVGIVLYLRKKEAPPSKKEAPAQGLPVDLATPFKAVKKDLGPALRFGPGVVAVGDAGWKSSRVLERLCGGSPATPAGDGSQLRMYRGKDAIVLELADAVFQNEAPAVTAALVKLGKELPSGVVLVCLAVDYRSLANGTLKDLKTWAELLQKRLPLLAKSGRNLGVRICVTGLESEPGFSCLRALWLSRRATSLTFLEVEHKAELQKFLSQVTAELGVVLSTSPQELESVARLALKLADALHGLSDLTLSLTEALSRYTQSELNGVYLTDGSGAAIPARPFAFQLHEVAQSRSRHERSVFVRQAIGAGALCLTMLCALCLCGLWVSRVGDNVRLYADSPGFQVGAPERLVEPRSPGTMAPTASGAASAPTGTSTSTASSPSQDSASSSTPAALAPNTAVAANSPVEAWKVNSWVPIETADRGVKAAESLNRLRLWPLPYAFGPQRQEQERAFVDATRGFYVKPALDPSRSLMRRVFAACLGRAKADNDFGRLVRENEQGFEATLGVPPQTLQALVRLGDSSSVETELPSLVQAVGSLAAWRGLVLSIVSAIDSGSFEPKHLAELRAEAFFAELPDDPATVRVLQRSVSLLAAHADTRRQDEVRAAQQIHAELEFLVDNLSSLSLLRDWFRKASLDNLPEPKSLAQLLELTIARPVEDPASKSKATAVEGPASIKISLTPPVTIEHAALERALVRTRASVLIHRFVGARREGAYERPYTSACGSTRPASPEGSSFFPKVAPSWGELRDKTPVLDALDSWSVRGPSSRGYGPTVTLPGWFTRIAVQRYVLPVIAATNSEVDVSVVTTDDLFTLRGFIDEELAGYADSYGRELACYFQSFRFQPASLPLAESAVRELAAEGSWFEQFLGVVGEQATLPPEVLANGQFAASVAGFVPLAKVVESKALKDYAALLSAALPGASAPSASAKPAEAKAKNVAIRRDERLDDAMVTLGTTTLATNGIVDWLVAQNITSGYQRPFLLPLESLRSAAAAEIRARWQRELVAPANALLRRYPFRPDDTALGGAVALPELEAEFGIDGRFWSVALQAFAPIVEAQPGEEATARNQWLMRPGLSEPQGLLDLLNAAERLTTALWAADGKRNKLKVRITPYELPVSRRGEPLIALAYLTMPGADAQSFNQALEARTLSIDWWSPDESTLSVELLDRYASEVQSFFTIEQKHGPWSFLRLIDGGHLQNNVLTYYLHGETRKESRLEFELHNDVRALFTDVAQAADNTREETQ